MTTAHPLVGKVHLVKHMSRKANKYLYQKSLFILINEKALSRRE
ncbi:MAG: hypothetical protein ACI956_000591, partial [Nonlabens sp.]